MDLNILSIELQMLKTRQAIFYICRNHFAGKDFDELIWELRATSVP